MHQYNNNKRAEFQLCLRLFSLLSTAQKGYRTKHTDTDTDTSYSYSVGDTSLGHYVHVIGIDNNTLTDWKYPTNWSIRCSRLRGRLNQSISMAITEEHFFNIFQKAHRTHTHTHKRS